MSARPGGVPAAAAPSRAGGVAAALTAVVALSAAAAAQQRSVAEAFNPGGALPAGPGMLGAYAGYVALQLALFALFAAVLRRALRQPLGRRAWAGACAAMLAAHGVYLAVMPAFSIDTLSYLGHGYQLAALGESPFLHPVRQLGGSHIGAALARYGWQPVHSVSPYGPLWTRLEALVATACAGQVRAGVFVFKGLAATGSLLAAWVVHRMHAGAPAGRRQAATLALGLNPLLAAELAGEGHIDGTLLLCVIVALACAQRLAVTRAGVALGVGILIKYIPLIFVPALLAHLLRHWPPRWLARAALAAAVSAALAAAAYRSLWAGGATFAGMVEVVGAADTASTLGLLARVLRGLGVPAARVDAAARPLACALGGLIVAIIVRAAAAVRRGRVGLGQAWAAAACAYLGVASPTYWPWYAVVPVALLAAAPDTRAIATLCAFSLGGRLVAPMNAMMLAGAVSRDVGTVFTVLAGIGMPAAVFWLTPRRGASGAKARADAGAHLLDGRA